MSGVGGHGARDGTGVEEVHVADGVIDASGVLGSPRWTGRGAIPAPGERRAEILRWLPDIHAEAGRWRDRRVVLVGNGHSAVTALVALAGVRSEGGTQVTWVVPDDRSRPCDEVAADPLPGRRDLVKRANDLAARPPPWLRVLRRGAVFAFSPVPADPEPGSPEPGVRASLVSVQTRSGVETVACDVVLSLVGYRPDRELLSGCAVSLDPAFEGGLALSGALSRVTDCLARVEVSAADLSSGEPDLYLAGHRSYGSRSTFLLQTAFDQLEVIFSGWKLRRKG